MLGSDWLGGAKAEFQTSLAQGRALIVIVPTALALPPD